MIVGLSMACVRMFQSKSWGFGIFLVFLVWLQLMMAIGEYQSLTGLKQMEKNMGELE